MLCCGEMAPGWQGEKRVYLCTKCGKAYSLDYETGEKYTIWRARRYGRKRRFEEIA